MFRKSKSSLYGVSEFVRCQEQLKKVAAVTIRFNGKYATRSELKKQIPLSLCPLSHFPTI